MWLSANNSPVLLIILYALPLIALALQAWHWFRVGLTRECVCNRAVWVLVLSLLLLGAGLALLGAAYLHDVWYC